MPACTWDPVQVNSNVVISNANLRASVRNTHSAQGTVGYNDVKRAFEVTYVSNGGAPQVAFIGVGLRPFTWTSFAGHYADSWAWYEGDSKVYYNNITSAILGAFPAVGTVIGVVFDPAAGTLKFYTNGTLQGTYTHAALIGALVYPVWSCGSTSLNTVIGDLKCINLAYNYGAGVYPWDYSASNIDVKFNGRLA